MTSPKRTSLLALFAVVLCWPTISLAQPKPAGELLQWKELKPLPDKVGFAGMVAGVSNDTLLAAGGANFPDPNGPKVYHDTIYALDKPDGDWKVVGKLKRPLAYAVSVTHDNRVICVGGNDDTKPCADAFALTWSNNKVEIQELSPLPTRCTNGCGALIGDTLYVAGGIDDLNATKALGSFFALDLSQPPEQQKWKPLPTWPGPERMLAVAASLGGKFYLFSGTQLTKGPDGNQQRIQPYLRDGYSYEPKTRRWTRLKSEMPRATVAAPGPAIVRGQSHVVIIGGDDKQRPPENHPGFPEDVLTYHPVTDQWLNHERLPKGGARVTAPVVPWGDRYLVINGEVRPRVRSPKVFSATPRRQQGFGWLNWTVVGLYLAALLGMGYFFSLRTKGTEDFFLAGHRIPWWAAGLSIYGTQLSAITFMAIPAAAYLGNWVRSISNVTILLVAPIVIFLYLPFYRRLNVVTAYEYLEKRFNLAIRWLGSLTFVVYHLGRMGIIFYLPSLALSTAIGFDNVTACILVLGVVCIFYTVLGGIEAVIWTDVLQVFVLLAGALFCLFLIAGELGGFGQMWTLASKQGKTQLFDWGIGFDKPHTWVIFVGTFFFNLMPYTTDQTVVQRYLTTRDERQAARGIWLNGLLAIPTTVLFFGLGTALYLFYQQNPTLLSPSQNDEIVPTYVVSQMPAGLAGLVIAGLFAAAMSSLDSSMNSIATAGVNDFYRRLKPETSDRQALLIAKVLTVIVGMVGVLTAILIADLGIRSIFDLFFRVMGMIGGSLTGIFVLGLFTRRAHALGVFFGAAAGIALPLIAQSTGRIDGFLNGAIGVLSCVIVGWTMSLILPGPQKDLNGLTLFTRRAA